MDNKLELPPFVFPCCRYRFKTGNVEYPSDKLYNASVIAALVPKNSYFSSPTLSSHTVQQQSFNNTYVTLGRF